MEAPDPIVGEVGWRDSLELDFVFVTVVFSALGVNDLWFIEMGSGG